MTHRTLGYRLQLARHEYGKVVFDPPRDLKPAELARLVGASAQAVNHWENDAREPDYETVERLAAALGVRAGWLVFGEEPMRAPGQAPAAAPPPARERADKPASAARTDVPHAKLDRMERERSEREEEERRRAAAKKRRRA